VTHKLHTKIRVAHLIGSTGLYGAERWILALMRALDPGQVNATLINLVDEQGGDSEVVSAAHQRDLDAFDFFTGGKFNPFAVVRLAQWARKEGIHIIHGHGFKSDVIGLFTARFAGCKVITTPHGWSLEADSMLKMYEKLDRSLFRFMDFVCPLSPELASEIDLFHKKNNMKLICNGVDLDEIQGVTPGLRLNADSFTIGYIGQLIDRKDLNTLLSAVKLLHNDKAMASLVVIGSGPKLSSLQEETVKLNIAAHVEFMGFKSDAAAYLKTFDLFVLPSLMEGIPRCIMEAMAAGIPVIVSDIPGNRNLVIHGMTGLLFTPGDSLDLAEKIHYVMKHQEHTEAMAVRATVKVEEEYSSRKMADNYVALYNQLREN
jgi:glycosyltransferase involved in cell wall biosynthesis